MRSYKEIIKDDVFDAADVYRVDTSIDKACWSCEKKHKSGYMVKDTTRMRRIFMCQDCYDKLKN